MVAKELVEFSRDMSAGNGGERSVILRSAVKISTSREVALG